MPRIAKAAIIALTLLAGAGAANADQLLKSLAATGSIITPHGLADGE